MGREALAPDVLSGIPTLRGSVSGFIAANIRAKFCSLHSDGSRTEMIREGYFGTKVDTIYDPVYLLASTLIMMCLGLALSRRVTDHVVPE
jgi:hypothetical protein